MYGSFMERISVDGELEAPLPAETEHQHSHSHTMHPHHHHKEFLIVPDGGAPTFLPELDIEEECPPPRLPVPSREEEEERRISAEAERVVHPGLQIRVDVEKMREAPGIHLGEKYPPTTVEIQLQPEVLQAGAIATNLPLRLDRLPWSRWHWLVALSLGTSWILDGLIVSCLGLIGSRLQDQAVLNLSPTQVGLIGSIYIAGAITGSIMFGLLADHFGRKKLFIVTPLIYLIAAQAAVWTFNFQFLASCIFFVGLGIGGEYSAMNSAINELIPAKIRGMVDLAINGSYWLGALIGAALTILFLDTEIFEVNVGWRYPFSIASILGVAVIVMRLFLPESPRWLILHGRHQEAEELVLEIESRVQESTGIILEPVLEDIIVRNTASKGYAGVVIKMITVYWRRSVLAMALMVAQAFFYNAIFFTYALILKDFYDIPSQKIGIYEIPFCLGNFLGSVLLGPLFDHIGRKPMIASTYIISALLLAGTGVLFVQHWLTAITQTICWSVIFFVSSASSSSAYLTISEIFPMEIRALAIALFYSCGTGLGGLVGPVLFGALIESKDRRHLFYGYLVGCGLMIGAAIIELIFGINAEQKSLEEIQEHQDAHESR